MRLYSILKTMAEKIKTLTPLWFTYSSYSFAVRIGNVLIQGGYNTIQPAAANTATLKTIKFPRTGYSIPPIAMTTILGTPPGVATCRITVKECTTSSVTVAVYASNTTERYFYWFVIGKLSGV